MTKQSQVDMWIDDSYEHGAEAWQGGEYVAQKILAWARENGTFMFAGLAKYIALSDFEALFKKGKE